MMVEISLFMYSIIYLFDYKANNYVFISIDCQTVHDEPLVQGFHQFHAPHDPHAHPVNVHVQGVHDLYTMYTIPHDPHAHPHPHPVPHDTAVPQLHQFPQIASIVQVHAIILEYINIFHQFPPPPPPPHPAHHHTHHHDQPHHADGKAQYGVNPLAGDDKYDIIFHALYNLLYNGHCDVNQPVPHDPHAVPQIHQLHQLAHIVDEPA